MESVQPSGGAAEAVCAGESVTPTRRVSEGSPRLRVGLVFGSLRLASRYLLAPLAGYTNLSFRLAVRSLGGLGLATTDLVNARASSCAAAGRWS